jgi:hypothetical protein
MIQNETIPVKFTAPRRGDDALGREVIMAARIYKEAPGN